MASGSSNIPLSLVQSYHFKERELYTRLVIDLHMDPTRAMEVIAFWLWQEENGHTNTIQKMSSLNDISLVEVASVAQTFVDAVRAEPQSYQANHGFRQEALQGIEYYLNSVCRKALDDIWKRAEEEARLRKMELLIRQMSQANINHQPYVPHGEGTSTGIVRRGNAISIANFERAMLSIGNPFDTLLRNVPEIPRFLRPGAVNASNFYLGGPSSPALPPPQWNIPPDERTLFVTFSNGFPFSEQEVYTFFMRYYGDVESVEIEKTEDDKPPLFAHVVFYSLETVLRILDGNLKVKFITNGKHLWARRFYPKRIKDKVEK